MVTAENFATQKTIADCGEFGTITFDEPIPHGGTGEGHHLFRECYLRFVRVSLLHLIELQMK